MKLMSNGNFSFNEKPVAPRRILRPEARGLTGLVIRHSGGRLKTVKQANVFFLAVLIVLIIVYLLLPIGETNEPVPEIIISPGETVGSQQGL